MCILGLAVARIHSRLFINRISKTKRHQVQTVSDAIAELDDIKETNAVIESAALPLISGNKKQLVHLFKNIISNGIKFQQPDVMPVVEIKAATVPDPEGLPAGTYVKISFTDNGISFG